MGRTDGLIKSLLAGAAIAARHIVKFGADDDTVVTAAAATDAPIGVTSEIDAALGEPCDVMLSGLAEVVYGGNVAGGDLLTSDANGAAVTAAPAAGVNNRVIGVAMASGVAGDIGLVLLQPGSVQG